MRKRFFVGILAINLLVGCQAKEGANKSLI
ncbi:colicin release lysis protein [Escherichia coli]